MWLYCGYYGSLNNALQANADFNKQIFARDCNNSGETEKVINLVVYIDRGVAMYKTVALFNALGKQSSTSNNLFCLTEGPFSQQIFVTSISRIILERRIPSYPPRKQGPKCC